MAKNCDSHRTVRSHTALALFLADLALNTINVSVAVTDPRLSSIRFTDKRHQSLTLL